MAMRWHRGVSGSDTVNDKPTGAIPRAHLVRRIAGRFRPYPGAIAAVFVCIVFTAGIGVVNPLLIKVIFDNALFCGSGCPKMGFLGFLVGLMILIPAVSGIIGILQTYLSNSVGLRVMEGLRNSLYAHLQGMSLRFFTGTRTGEIQSRLTNDVGGVQSIVTDTVATILSNVVILLSTLVAMLLLSWQLTVLSFALTPLFVFFTYRAGKARRRIASKTQDARAEMTAITEETLSVSGILLAKVFGRGPEEMRRFADENRRLADLALRQEMVGRGLFAIIGTFFSGAPAIVYLLAGFVLSGPGHHDITAGTIVAFTTLQSRLFFPIGQMLQVSVEVQASLALFERVFQYLDLEHDIVDAPDAVAIDPATTQGHLRLDHVSFRYAPDEVVAERDAAPEAAGDELARPWALHDISLDVQPGQLAAIVGPSGAGKTTISYLVPRLYDVTEGSVSIDGLDVRQVSQRSLADVIAMVTQETYLFHASIRRNLMYAKPSATQQELEEACRAAFIHDRIAEMPEGYDTLVGERGYRMSGGEKQRIALARVILKAPRILILDEATSALDTLSEKLIQTALGPLMRGRTTIAIAHRLSTILAADVIFVLDRGQVVERGSHAELLLRGGLYARLYEQQFGGGEVEAVCEDGVILATGDIVAGEAAS